MLVLSRKKSESIMIGEDIEVFVVEIGPNQVKLGIKAPKSVAIHRREVFEAIKEESRQSAQTSRNFTLKKEQLKDLFKKIQN
ncbi:MAG TPA: carbon storage regulator CsrA [Clostridia bacterium]|nr:carbon storage regulator CsrA [Clostridia bacterium]